MASQKRSKSAPTPESTTCPASASVVAPPPSSDIDSHVLVPGPKLRRVLGISAVSLWRWRNDERLGFPPAKLINGRLYFSWMEVRDWLARFSQSSTRTTKKTPANNLRKRKK
jgi:hypothetical protein